jgi:ABC-type phosphate transport system auxiliary subunit
MVEIEMQECANSILNWFKSTNFYDYFNWLLSQPSSDVSGIMLVGVVLIVAIVIVVVVVK